MKFSIMAFRLHFVCILMCTSYLLASCDRPKSQSIDPNKMERPDLEKMISDAVLIIDANPDSALKLLNSTFAKCEEAHYNKGIARCYNISNYILCVYQQKFDEGIAKAKEQLAFAKETESSGFLCDAYISMGLTFAVRDISDSAAYYYLKGIELAELRMDTTRLLPLYGNIVLVYNLQADFKNALLFSNKAVAMAKGRKNDYIIATNYNNQSIIYKALIDTPQSRKMLKAAYSYLPTIKDVKLQMDLLQNMSIYFFETHQIDSSKIVANQLVDIAQKTNDTMAIVSGVSQIIECELELGNTAIAIQKFEVAKDIFANANLSLIKAKGLKDLTYKLYKKSGRIPMALLAHEQLVNIADSLKNRNQNEILVKTEKEILKNKYEISLAEKELGIRKKNNVINLLIISSIALCIIGVLFYFHQRKKKQLHQKNMLFLKKENEWITSNAALQAQLLERKRISREIHDELGASLTSIALTTDLLRSKMDGHTEEVDKIAQTSSNMVDSLNEIIWSLNSGNDSVKSLVSYIRKTFFSFLEDSGITHHFEADAITDDYALNGSIRRAIYLTTKEALNNAMKHAKAKVVRLTIAINKNYLLIHLQDDGVGLLDQNEFGNGLKNMKHNMESIGGSIQFKNENGTKISIHYPLSNQIANEFGNAFS